MVIMTRRYSIAVLINTVNKKITPSIEYIFFKNQKIISDIG